MQYLLFICSNLALQYLYRIEFVNIDVKIEKLKLLQTVCTSKPQNIASFHRNFKDRQNIQLQKVYLTKKFSLMFVAENSHYQKLISKKVYVFNLFDTIP